MTRDEVLIGIARILTTERDVTEALRLAAREVAKFAGAETAAVYLIDREYRVLHPVAAYRVPKDTLPVVTSAMLPIDAQGFRDSVFTAAAVTWSDDVQNDPRFAFELFHRFPHRSGVVVPVHVDGDVGGAFYLVWWERAERLDPERTAALQAVGQMVALLLRSAWALREAARERAEALAAKERYRALFERVPIGLYRTTPSGKIHDVNPAMVEILGFPDAESLRGVDARSLWVNPDDRRREDSTERSRDVRAELRTASGGTVWVRVRSRAVEQDGEVYWEGVLEDITAERRAEAAERRAETLRAVAQLANAAAHEINNPLAIIVGRLELLRRQLTQPEYQKRFDDVIAASKRITDIVAHMARMTRLETVPGSQVPAMLDLRVSGPLPDTR